MPTNLDELIDFDEKRKTIPSTDLDAMQKSLCNNSTIFEVLHLVMRFIHPENKAVKFDKTEFRRYLLKDHNDLKQKL
jgi:hypothetical protein